MIDRRQAEIILGARVRIAKFKADPTKPINADSLPTLPTAEDAGPWVTLGRIRTAKPQTDYKTADIEGVGDNGIYSTQEMRMASKIKLLFTTNDVAPEALQLTFGLRNEIQDTVEQTLFGSSGNYIECWLHLELTDAYRNGADMANMTMCGRLSLTNPLEAKSDPALAEYELMVVPNDLAKFTSTAIAPKPSA